MIPSLREKKLRIYNLFARINNSILARVKKHMEYLLLKCNTASDGFVR